MRVRCRLPVSPVHCSDSYTDLVGCARPRKGGQERLGEGSDSFEFGPLFWLAGSAISQSSELRGPPEAAILARHAIESSHMGVGSHWEAGCASGFEGHCCGIWSQGMVTPPRWMLLLLSSCGFHPRESVHTEPSRTRSVASEPELRLLLERTDRPTSFRGSREARANVV